MRTNRVVQGAVTFAWAAVALASPALVGGALAQGQASPPPPVVEPSAAPPAYVGTPMHHSFLYGDQAYRSPGLAVALSLTPLPVDFGNLYAENLGWGVAYTAVEVSLMAPMMWFAGSHMSHSNVDDRRWGDGERAAMVGLVAGYVGVKLVAGLHAGYAAREFNTRHAPRSVAVLVPRSGGAVLGWQSRF
jgi:hypothetical protein